MTEIDRYILTQLIWSFLFFLLVFSGIIWVTSAIGILNFFVDSGQSASAFLELSLLNFPKVWVAALGISAFAAAISVANRLYNDSELTVMNAAGQTAKSLMKPFFGLGLIAGLLTFATVYYLDPISRQKIQTRSAQIAEDYIVELIAPGKIISEGDGITMYFGGNTPDGRLSDVFIEERPNDIEVVSYIAAYGQLVRQEGAQKLVLFDGSIQQRLIDEQTVNSVKFDSFSFDLGQLGLSPNQLYKDETILTGAQSRKQLRLINLDPQLRNTITAGLVNGYAQSLQALFFPMLALSILLFGSHRRNGILRRILAAVIIGVALDAMRGVTFGWVLGDYQLSYTQFFPSVLTVLIALLLVGAIDGHVPQLKLPRLARDTS